MQRENAQEPDKYTTLRGPTNESQKSHASLKDNRQVIYTLESPKNINDTLVTSDHHGTDYKQMVAIQHDGMERTLNTHQTAGQPSSLTTHHRANTMANTMGNTVDQQNYQTAQIDRFGTRVSRSSLKQAIKDRKYTKSQELKHRVPRKRYYNGIGKIMVNQDSIRQQKLENIPFKKLSSRNDIGTVSCKIGGKKSGTTVYHQRQLSLNAQQYGNNQLAFNFNKDQTILPSFDNNNKNMPLTQVFSGSENIHDNIEKYNNRTPLTSDVMLSGQQFMSAGQQVSTNMSDYTQEQYAQQFMDQQAMKQLSEDVIFVGINPLQIQQQMSAKEESIFTSDQAKWGPQRSVGREGSQPSKFNNNLGIDLDLFRRRTVMVAAGGDTSVNHRSKRNPFMNSTTQNTYRNLQQLPLLEEAAVSHMMEKVDKIPKIRFTLDRGSIKSTDKMSEAEQHSANTWLQQRQREQEQRRKQLNDRIIEKRLNQLCPDPNITQRNPDDEFLFTSNQGLSGQSQPLFNIDEDQLNKKASGVLTTGIYSDRDRQIQIDDVDHFESLKQKSQLVPLPNEMPESDRVLTIAMNKKRQQSKKLNESPTRNETQQKNQLAQMLQKQKDTQSKMSETGGLTQESHLDQKQSTKQLKIKGDGARGSQDEVSATGFDDDDEMHSKGQRGGQETTITINEMPPSELAHHSQFAAGYPVHEDDLIKFSSGNVYNANMNPQVKKFVSQVADFLEHTDKQVNEKKDHMGRISQLIKQTKNAYLETLIQGEANQHCTGIHKRFEETKFNMRQHQQLQPEEEEVSIKKEQKKLRDEAKILERKKRVEVRQENLWRQQQIGSSMPVRVPNYLMPKTDYDNPGVFTFQQWMNNTKEAHASEMADAYETGRTGVVKQSHSPPQNSSKNMLALPAHQDKRQSLQAPNMRFRQQLDARSKAARFTVNPKSLNVQDINLRPVVKSSTFVSNFAMSKKEQAQQNIQQRKQQQQHNNKLLKEKLKVFRDAFCIQKLPPPYDVEIEELYKSSPGSHHKGPVINNLNILYKHLSTEKFERQRPLTNKKIQAQFRPKKLILHPTQLGLEKQKDFQELSQYLFRGSNFGRLDHREFSKVAFREHLKDRYSKLISDRIMLVLESQEMITPQMSEMGYNQMICDILNQGPEFYKKLLFACLSQQPGRLCEHDIFALLQTFKQIDSYYFFRELINRKEVPRDFKNVKDNSDQIFFEAFAPDIIEISHTMGIRKRLLGIFDNDKEKNFMNDIQETTFESYSEYEEEIVRQIEYTASIIAKTYNQKNSLMTDMLDILTNEHSLLQIRASLIQMVIDKKILQVSRKKSQQEAEPRSTKQINVQSLFKPPSNIYPCIGSDVNAQTGSRVSNCIYMNYDDFMKLIDFPADTVSSFMDDFIDHLTAGCVSLKHFEEHLGKYREYERENRDRIKQPEPKNYLEGTNLIEYLEKRNIEMYGNSLGDPSRSIQAKKVRQGKTQRKIAPHVIDQPFNIQDHYINGDFCGKLLIQNVVNKEKQKSSGKAKKKVNNLLKIDSSDSDDSMEKSQRRQAMKTVMIPVADDQISELVEYRQFFKDPQFFKIFRIFYALAVVPEDVQNNPFLLFIDRESILRNFFKVFNIQNEEIAIRFYCLLLKVKGQPPKKHQEKETEEKQRVERKKGEIDLVQYFRTVKYICHTNLKETTQFMRMAFHFLDYDDNGSIGSVDILNLRKSFDQSHVDMIQVIFEKDQIKKSIANRLQAISDKSKLKQGFQAQLLTNVKAFQVGLGGILKAPRRNHKKDNKSDCDTNSHQSDGSEFEQEDLMMSDFDIKNELTDPWNRFLMEVALLRDYFVENAIHSSKKQKDQRGQNFLNLHTYHHDFLQMVRKKYEVKTPCIIWFFKSKFEYPHDLEFPQDLEPQDCFKGFDHMLQEKVEKVPITDELIKMQDMLDQIARNARFNALQIYHD